MTETAPPAQLQGTVSLRSILMYGLAIYLVYTVLFASPLPQVTPVDMPIADLNDGALAEKLEQTHVKQHPNANKNLVGLSDSLRMIIAVSHSNETFQLDSAVPGTTHAIVWEEEGLLYNFDSENERSAEVVLPVSDDLLKDGTLFAHLIFQRESYEKGFLEWRKVHPLFVSMKLPREKKKINLLSSSGEKEEHRLMQAEQALVGDVYAPHYNPTVSISLVTDTNPLAVSSLPANIVSNIHFTPYGYYPVVYMNSFWTMRGDYYPVNDTITSLPLHLSYYPISLMKWTMLSQMEDSLTMQDSLGGVEGESDSFKEMIRDTNPWFLGLTATVSVLHSIFDFMAFKNDIKFWKERDTLAGISVRTVLVQVIMQTIIFLYLLDNDTSWMIVISSGIGLLIEVWKLRKCMDFTFNVQFPFLHLKDKPSMGYADSETKKYDEMALKYLGWIFFPLLVGYFIYSMIYDEHRGWYSFILTSLTSGIYVFGFILMTPQLFVNYKLQSVAAMPWKAMSYKFLNTIIDDLFAFIIKMPLLHRLACFRDDVVFLVFIYQYFAYKVDMTRKNEFGISGEMLQKMEESKKKPSIANADANPNSNSLDMEKGKSKTE